MHNPNILGFYIVMDTLVKALAHQGAIRIIVCDTTETVRHAAHVHQSYPTSTAALGRTLSVAALMGSMLKDEEAKILIQIDGGGPLGSIVVDVNSKCEVRGFVGNPDILLINEETHKLDVGKAVGNNGILRVTQDLKLKEKFTGTVELQTGEIAEDFAYYFTVSEQTPSAVSLGVLVDENNEVVSAGGLLIQMMPFASEADIMIAEDVIKHIKPISTMIQEGMTPMMIVEALFQDVTVLSQQEVSFKCDCSKERMFEALRTLKASDLLEMIEEDHGAELNCHFCNTNYRFSEDELRSMIRAS